MEYMYDHRYVPIVEASSTSVYDITKCILSSNYCAMSTKFCATCEVGTDDPLWF